MKWWSTWKLRWWVLRWLLGRGKPNFIHYIGSTEVLPPPLKEHEESDLITRLDQGDMAVRTKFIGHKIAM